MLKEERGSLHYSNPTHSKSVPIFSYSCPHETKLLTTQPFTPCSLKEISPSAKAWLLCSTCMTTIKSQTVDMYQTRPSESYFTLNMRKA